MAIEGRPCPRDWVRSFPVIDRTREQDLLLCCSRARADASTRERIAALLDGDLDWDRFLQLANVQQVTPLVASMLCGSFESRCPPEVVERLRSDARAVAMHSLRLAHGLADVLGLFAARGIPVIPYKGPTLSAMAYGQAGLRQFGDLDVWVHPWDYRFQVPGMLAANGWLPAADYSWECSFRHPHRDIVLDVHQALTHRPFTPFSLRFDDALRRGVDVEVAGRHARTLAAPDLLVVLCVQLAKDAGEERDGPPLIKVCDIAELMRSHPQLDWHATVRIARDEGVLRVLCLGVAVAAKLLGTRIPEEIERLIRDVPDLDALVRHVEERVFDEGHRRYTRPELLDRLTWNAAIRERFRDRNRTVIALMQDVFVPNDPEYALVRLPRSLFPLYRLVRPARLAWKYFCLALGLRPGGTPRQ